MEDFIWISLTVLRLVVPLTILRWPLIGILASIIVDSNDYYLLPLKEEGDYTQYQAWDKLLDLYYLAFAAFFAYKINDKYIRRVAMCLFAWRLIGVVILEFTQNRQLLLVFPNVFENFVIFYLVYKLLEPDIAMPRSKLVTAIVVIGLAVPKQLQEQYLHVAETYPTEVLGGLMQLSTAMYAAYVIIPVLLLAYLTRGFVSLRRESIHKYSLVYAAIQQKIKP
ncbi:MAG: hypothetical protein ABIQ64_00420 [Candidatus Saccharimonadales bacterium]